MSFVVYYVTTRDERSVIVPDGFGQVGLGIG